MNNQERLDLKKLLNEVECDNNTDNIRKLRHSVKIRDDVRRIENLKTNQAELNKNDKDKFIELCQTECSFLFNNYTDIFNKAVNDEIDLTIMTKLLTVLKLIEDGKVDQHEGSVMVGKILKELYVDSAMKRSENIDRQHETERLEPAQSKNISWRDYKKMNM
jgi:hypothetical protein